MAITREQNTNSRLKQLLAPIAVSASKDDITAVDITGFESATFVVTVGAAAVAPADDKQVQIRLKHSNDNINFADCAPEEIVSAEHGFNNSTFGSIKSAPNENTSFMAAYIGDKRYVRPAITVTGDADALGDGVIIGISAILHNPKYRPVT